MPVVVCCDSCTSASTLRERVVRALTSLPGLGSSGSFRCRLVLGGSPPGRRGVHMTARTSRRVVARRRRRRGYRTPSQRKKEKATYKRCDANLERGRVVPAEEAVLRRGIGDRTNDRSVSGGSASPSTERWPAAIRSLSRAMRDPNTSVPLVLPVECARRISSGAACL